MTSDPFSFRQGAMGGMRSSDVMGNIGEIPAITSLADKDNSAFDDRARIISRLMEHFPYNAPRSCRVCIKIKDVSKPCTVEHGDSFEKDEATNEFVVKDATGAAIGKFRCEIVDGWWLESEPINMKDLSPRDLDRVVAELSKRAAINLD